MKAAMIVFLSGFFSPLSVLATEGDYAASKIPQPLLTNAHAVKRFERYEYEVISYTKARYYKKEAFTILDESGEKFAAFHVFYDKLRSVKSIEGKLFDQNGKEIKSLKSKDIKDYSAISDFSLVEDGRVKVHNFYHKVFPYTVEYEVVVEYNNTCLFPDWFPQTAEQYSVEEALAIIKCPSWYSFRYKAFNYAAKEPVITDEKDLKVYTWRVNNMPSVVKEYASPDWPLLTTCVYFTPDKFEMEGYKGSFATWKDFGLFQQELNKGRDKLPDAVKQQVHALTDGIADPAEKVRVLYEYMQKNTRYISIQLGIGGLQPFDAAYVAKNAYGDCKALSNYMYSLLKEANIPSSYTIINSGRGEHFFLPDFPSDQFNHIILCVPLQKDTMWLECTSQTLPAGYLGSHTDNRYALAVNEDGGKLVHTPVYGAKSNLQVRHIKATLDEEATLEVKAETKYTGLQQDYYHGMIHHNSKDKIKERLQEHLDFATYNIRDFNYSEQKSTLPAVQETLDITVSNYATVTGKRLFITPNIMTKFNTKLLPDKERKYDLEFSMAFIDTDTSEVILPAGFVSESMPKDVAISCKFGKYSSSVKVEGNKLIYYRNFETVSGHFPPSDYAELVKFYDAVYRADRNKVVLVKNETTEKKGF